MKRFIWLIAVCVFLASCAAPRFQVAPDNKNFFKESGKKIFVADIFFYPDVEKDASGREVVKGDPDLSPKYLELAKFFKLEMENQLKERGFVVERKDDPAALKLTIRGMDKKVFLSFNDIIGGYVEGAVAGKQVFYQGFFRLYNPIFPKEGILKSKIVPAIAEALEMIYE